jgi:hypothetical protein
LARRKWVSGWALRGIDPETPLAIGDGRHGFDITVPGRLSPPGRHVLLA